MRGLLTQTRPRPLANPPCHVCELPTAPGALQGHLAVPLAGVRRGRVPEGRPAQGRRAAERAAEPAHGPRCDGRHDGPDEDADGDDGPADGHHGLDQFLLPGLRAQ